MAEKRTSSLSLALLVALLASLLFGVTFAGLFREAHRAAALRTAGALRPLLGAALAEGDPEKVALLLETVRGTYSAAVYDAGGSLLVGAARPGTPGRPVPPLPEKAGAPSRAVGGPEITAPLESPAEGAKLGTLYLRDDAPRGAFLAAWVVASAAALFGAGLLSLLFRPGRPGPAAAPIRPEAGADVGTDVAAAAEVTGLARAVAADHDYRVRAETRSPLVEAVNEMLASIGRRDAEREAERRRAAEQAQALRAAVERLEQEKAAVPVSGLDQVRPELEASLRGIVGQSALLAPKLSEPHRRAAASIGRHGAHLLALVGGEAEDASFDLAELLEQLSAVFATRAAERGLGFSFEAVGALPGSVRGSAPALRRGLLTLVGNAFRFTEDGRVELVAGAVRDRFRFELRDTAPTLSAGSESDPRFGAGLADASRQIAALGGELKFRPAPEGAGNVFWFDIPLAAA